MRGRNEFTLMLTVTEKCNLNCIYCYEQQKNTNYLDTAIAKKKIEEIICNKNPDLLIISFHGGEPFLCFSQIKIISEWIWNQEWGNKCICFAATNGTLVNGEIKDWLIKNRERFYVGLSYDGNVEMQNINRSNSSKYIDLDFFKENWPNQSLKMTISDKTIDKIADGIIFLHKKGFNVNANLAFGISFDFQEEIFKRELLKLVQYYINSDPLEISNLLDVNLSLVTLDEISPLRWCGCGNSMIAIDPEGKEYPCHTFFPSSVGNIDTEKCFSILQKNIELDPKCKACIIKNVCPTCYGLNYANYKNFFKKDNAYCSLMKIRALASSYMYGKMFCSDRKYKCIEKLDENMKNAYKKGIILIQEHLQ